MSIETTEKQDVAMSAGIDLDTTTDEILLAATNHDLETLRRLLGSDVGAANVQDPETGFAPLHAAIASCEADEEEMKDADGEEGLVNGAAMDEESCLETVKLLFENGAIWNELDNNDETPGCIAHRLGLKTVYEAIVQAGMRAELLFNRLDAFAPLFGGDSEEEEDEDEDEKIRKRLLKEQAGEGEEFDDGKLRQYQLERLRYYYAVIECDSNNTAKTIYDSLDNREYLTTSNFFDLRFIPDEVTFDDDNPRDVDGSAAG